MVVVVVVVVVVIVVVVEFEMQSVLIDELAGNVAIF